MGASRAHAILSASGAERWMACPPSARIEADMPDTSSGYAEEGTFAHTVSEIELAHRLVEFQTSDRSKLADSLARYNERLEPLKENDFWSQGLHDHVMTFVDIVMERVAEGYARSSDTLVQLEQRLDFSQWVPEGFGTGDVVIVSDGVLEVIDLKFGQGVAVSAIDNPQLRLYGLGALAVYDMLYDIHEVRMTIVQPRLDSVSTEVLESADLLGWADVTVAPKAALAWEGVGEFQAGDHCRFCKIRATCRARAKANLDLAKYEFAKPVTLSVEEIAEILGRADELRTWAGDIQSYAQTQAADHDVTFPGWKLVEGRSNRRYSDEEAVGEKLRNARFRKRDIYEEKLLGITKMESLVGKKRFSELLEATGLVTKPPGKPTLVPESDKRPEINSVASAETDFAPVAGRAFTVHVKWESDNGGLIYVYEEPGSNKAREMLDEVVFTSANFGVRLKELETKYKKLGTVTVKNNLQEDK